MIVPNDRALRAFASRDLGKLAALGGLPAGLPPDEVAAALGANPQGYVRWFLGAPPLETFWCPITGVEGFDDRIKIWFRDDVVVKVEGEYPELPPGAAEALGPPDLRLDHRMSMNVVKDGEHVWASCGVALKLNRSGTRAVELSAFPPTTPARYRETLQDAGEYREIGPPGKGHSA